MKKSKAQRKFVNQTRGMGDIPWPARRFKYPPTFGDAKREVVAGRCPNKLGEQKVRVKRLRRKQTQDVKCGGEVVVRRRKDGRHRAYCRDCRARREQRKQLLRMTQRIARFTPRAQAQAERREVSRFRRFVRRAG